MIPGINYTLFFIILPFSIGMPLGRILMNDRTKLTENEIKFLNKVSMVNLYSGITGNLDKMSQIDIK